MHFLEVFCADIVFKFCGHQGRNQQGAMGANTPPSGSAPVPGGSSRTKSPAGAPLSGLGPISKAVGAPFGGHGVPGALKNVAPSPMHPSRKILATSVVGISGASFRKNICSSPSDVREVRQISVQNFSEVELARKLSEL